MSYCRKCGSLSEEGKTYCSNCIPKISKKSAFKEKAPYFLLGLLLPFVAIIFVFLWWNDPSNYPKVILKGVITSIVSSVLIFAAYVLVLVVIITRSGGIEYDEEQIEVYNDALNVESAAEMYCELNVCGYITLMEYEEIEMYLTGVDITKYDLNSNGGIIVSHVNGRYKVSLERIGTGGYEFPYGQTPSESNISDVEIDND